MVEFALESPAAATTHSGLIQTVQQQTEANGASPYRGASTYHIQDYYVTQNEPSTGAVPRGGAWHGSAMDPTKPSPRPISNEDYTNNSQTVAIQMENKDASQKDQKNLKSVTKTYHTIKDIISNRFKSSKDNIDEKNEEAGLNNVAEDIRKSQGNIIEEIDSKKPPLPDQAYTKQTGLTQQQQQQQQYKQQTAQQQFIQQQMLVQHTVQMQQYQHQLSQQQQYAQKMAQVRSQMIGTARQEELYYQTNYVGNVQRAAGRFAQVGQQVTGHGPSQPSLQTSPERRSAQQLERDSLRQRSFEARRAASQPQLAYDHEGAPDTTPNRPQPQIPVLARRGSHGNIMDSSKDAEKDSDDGGFLKRPTSDDHKDNVMKQKDSNLQHENVNTGEHKKENSDEKPSPDPLQGSPRKRLEGEIGKIEGVYNVTQRTSKLEEEPKVQKKTNPSSSANNSDYDKTGGQSSSNVDSGRGSAAYSSGRRPAGIDLNGDYDSCQINSGGKYRDVHSGGHDSEWVDIVENELRHILEPKLHELSLQDSSNRIANSTMSESISSMTPPLPPLSPGDQSSPTMTPRNSNRYKHSSLPYGSKPEYDGFKAKSYSRDVIGSSRWNGMSNQKHRTQKKLDPHTLLREKQIFGLDTTDITSTTTRSMDLESMLDGQTDSDGDISTTDARTIRKQLEGLETMYSEVLKLLGVKKHPGRYQPSDPRFNKRRYGSMSSLPSSSVSSRPIRDKRRTTEERKKVRDMRGINKRFQRLESHVVTLARSVAHLSSEMRTQHLMIQEMENIRGEIAALRTQTNMLNVRSQSASRAVSSKELPTLANPARVKKLTKFFGDEPPLLRLFLRKLGYEKYASVFESERIGMVELPYLDEDRLQKMGIPLGPRLRMMQEAQISVCKDNTLCIN
nr:unnamed protein product [Callosobruchus chinensis]